MSRSQAEVSVAPMQREHVRTAGRLLAAAFDDDPVIGHFLPRTAKRRLVLPGFFRSTVEEALPLGHVYEVVDEGRLTGAAVWFPPAEQAPQDGSPWRARAALLPARLAYGQRLTKLLGGFAQLAEHHPQEPHWYLAFVGISPPKQSRGLGAHLLAPVLEQADLGAQPCYLETPFPQTHSFYERLGFTRVAELHAFEDAPSVVTFLRMPRPRS